MLTPLACRLLKFVYPSKFATQRTLTARTVAEGFDCVRRSLRHSSILKGTKVDRPQGRVLMPTP